MLGIATVLCIVLGVIHMYESKRFCVEVGLKVDGVVPSTCLTPHSFLVIWITVLILLALANDIAPDIVLIFFTAVLTIIPMDCIEGKNIQAGQNEPAFGCRIVTEADAWRGFANPAILAAATLLVYARCLEETRVVELMITPCLQYAKNEVAAVALLAYPTFFFSSFLNSTPIVAMLIPVCEAWCAKTGFKLTTVLMPLSFSAMLGGLTSLVGTASNMVLVALIQADETPPMVRPFGFMDQAIAGVPAAIVALAFLSFAAPYFLGGKSTPEGSGPKSTASSRLDAGSADTALDETSLASANAQRGYELRAVVSEGFPYVERPVGALETMQPVETETRSEKGMASTKSLAVCSTNEARLDASVPTETSIRVEEIIRSDGTRLERTQVEQARIELGDKLTLSVGAIMVPALRRLDGLVLDPEEASAAVPKSKKPRALFQGVLSKRSTLVGLPPSSATEELATEDKVVWSVRRGSHFNVYEGANAPLEVGDTLLFEADEDVEDRRENHTGFSLLMMVPGSSVSHVNPALASCQFWLSVVSLLLMVFLSIGNLEVPLVPILPLSFFLGFFLIAIGCITPEQAWLSVKYHVVLTIMAAFGLGTALENTGVSEVIASLFQTLGEAMGAYPYLLIIFHFTAMLSWLVGSTPAIILLYGAVSVIPEVAGIKPPQALLALMLGAVCAMATPVGFATNLMVQSIAGYKFVDFVALGATTTVVVGLISCAMIMLPVMEDILPPSATINTTKTSETIV